MDRSVSFLYLQQEDCVKAGGYDMAGAMQAVERSFFLHGKEDYIQPGKPVIRWGGPETEETVGRIMSMPSLEQCRIYDIRPEAAVSLYGTALY